MAQVCHYFPGEFRGGAIPVAEFWALARKMKALMALERVQMTTAVALAVAKAWGGGDKVDPALAADRKEAFPDG